MFHLFNLWLIPLNWNNFRLRLGKTSKLVCSISPYPLPTLSYINTYKNTPSYQKHTPAISSLRGRNRQIRPSELHEIQSQKKRKNTFWCFNICKTIATVKIIAVHITTKFFLIFFLNLTPSTFSSLIFWHCILAWIFSYFI